MMFYDLNREIFNMNCMYLDEEKKHLKLPLKSAIKKDCNMDKSLLLVKFIAY